MLVATLAVIGIPVMAVSALRASGSVTSLALLLLLSVAVSLLVSTSAAALWSSQRGGGDTVFGDLMLWGWLRRRRQERQLASAVELLGLENGRRTIRFPAEQLSLRRRARLLEQLATALEARDPDTHGHSRRVARHATAIAKRMGLPKEQVSRIRTAAAIHDIGKIETPLEILNKEGGLTDEEFAVVKLHSVIGAQMVSGLGDEELTEDVRYHHERIDGKGYPRGLKGEEIPIGARVIAVADTFDALTSPRPYRPAMRHREALKLLDKEVGTQLDPHAVRAFRRYYSGWRPIVMAALLLNGPRQVALSLTDELRLGGVAMAAKATLATVGTVAAGGLAVNSFEPGPEPQAPAAASTRLATLPAGDGGNDSRRAEGTSRTGGSEEAKGRSTPQVEAVGQPVSSGPEAVSSPGAGSGESTPAAQGPGTTGAGPSGSEGATQPANEGGSTPTPIAEDVPVTPSVTLPETSQATAPVSSVVGGVVETVESVPAGKTVLDTVQSVTKGPIVTIGGNRE